MNYKKLKSFRFFDTLDIILGKKIFWKKKNILLKLLSYSPIQSQEIYLLKETVIGNHGFV
jgi:hypothetical protein